MKKLYPIELEKSQDDFTFKPGNWYECLRANSGLFTTGKGYLCCKLLGKIYLVNNVGEATYIKTIVSDFRMI